MKPTQLSFLSTFLILAFNSPSAAELFDTITPSAVAAKNCPAEWNQFENLKPNAWINNGPFEIDPNISPATTAAFNKYTTAVTIHAEYMSFFVGFADIENYTERNVALARAKYKLAICLTPTQAERDLIVELAKTKIKKSEHEISHLLFETFEKFECMQWAKASQAFFNLEFTNGLSSDDFTSLLTANLKACP